MDRLGRRSVLWFCILIGSVACWPLKSPPASGTAPSGYVSAVAKLLAVSGDTVIQLSWQAVPGAGGYSVFRDNSSTPLNPTPISETQYEDIGLTNGRTYTYIVAAVTPDGRTGLPSAPIQVAPQSP